MSENVAFINFVSIILLRNCCILWARNQQCLLYWIFVVMRHHSKEELTWCILWSLSASSQTLIGDRWYRMTSHPMKYLYRGICFTILNEVVSAKAWGQLCLQHRLKHDDELGRKVDCQIGTPRSATSCQATIATTCRHWHEGHFDTNKV